MLLAALGYVPGFVIAISRRLYAPRITLYQLTHAATLLPIAMTFTRAIARALISQPKIVLADEPTAALDKKSGRDVVELMQKLAKEQGCTILLVTHDNRILDIADRIIYMEDGRLISDGVDAAAKVS